MLEDRPVAATAAEAAAEVAQRPPAAAAAVAGHWARATVAAVSARPRPEAAT